MDHRYFCLIPSWRFPSLLSFHVLCFIDSHGTLAIIKTASYANRNIELHTDRTDLV